MFRIGIMGAENSHAMAFTEAFNGLVPDLADEFQDIQVVAVGGNYPEENKKVFERGKLELLCQRPEEMLGKVDAVMVTARDGKYHLPFARPFLEAGLPVFVDKPFTSSIKDAEELCRLAEAHGSFITGGTGIKKLPGVEKLRGFVQENEGKIISGDVTAPVNMVNDYGNFWFYAAHLAETCLAIFGEKPEWVWASRNKCGVTAIVHYPNGLEVTNHYTEGAYHYSATVTVSEAEHHELLSLDNFYAIECREFANALRTGKSAYPVSILPNSVRLMAATEKSFSTGEKTRI